MSTSSSEFETLVRLTPDLQLAVKDDLPRLGSKLLSIGLIPVDRYNHIILNPYRPQHELAADLVQLVQEKVQQNPQNYHIFITILEEDLTLYGDILERLQKIYNGISTGVLYCRYYDIDWVVQSMVVCYCVIHAYI